MCSFAGEINPSAKRNLKTVTLSDHAPTIAVASLTPAMGVMSTKNDEGRDVGRTLLVIDDHLGVADALTHLLGPDVWSDVHQAADASTALAMADRHRPDLVTLNLDIGHEPLALLAQLTSEHPRLLIAVLTSADDPETARAVIEAGASAFIPKSTPPDQVTAALASVLGGSTWLPVALIGPVLDQLMHPMPPDEWHLLVASLSPREHEVLQLMVAGLNRRSISEQLMISLNTVRTHVKNILAQLGVHSSLEAVSLALRAGLRPPDPGSRRP